MKYYMKQAIFTLTDTFSVYDENAQEVYHAKADFFTIGHQVPVYKYNEKIGGVFQRLTLFRPSFDIYLREEYLGKIIKEITFLGHYYTLEYKDWTVHGDFWSHEYQVLEAGGQVVMYLDKEWFTWGDAYCLNIIQEEYEEICIMIALAVDVAMCSQK